MDITMPRFIYRAKDGPDNTVEGELAAENEAAALARIEAMGYSPVWVRALDRADAAVGSAAVRVRGRDVTIFTRQLAGMIKSGVPILRALKTVREQSADGGFQRVAADLENTVRDGRMLSEAFAKHPAVFPELYVSMVRSGESGGILDVVLARLADAREKEDEVRKKVQAALAYPALVLSVGVLTVFVMVTLILPRISGFFRNFRNLPMPTRILLFISDSCRDYWPWGLVLIVLAVAVFRRVTAGGKGRTLLDRAVLRLPIAGSLVLEANVSRFARTMALLVDAGIPVDRALSLGAATMSNSVLRAEIEEVRRSTVEHGMSVAAGLRKAEHFPVYAQSMAAVGEESGRLDEALSDVASFYEKEVERRIGIMTSLIEPVLILAVGAVVGFIVFAMMMPIFAISSSFR